MGLAASQARFLAITSRKAQCEFESMQIAQQKLSISRELEKATSDYQESLNASRLVLDPDGTGDITFPLNYNIMMYPSDVNDYMPLMLARRDGKIALNGSMAAAAKAAGISDNGSLGGKSRDEAYQAFIGAMIVEGGMSATTAELFKDKTTDKYRYFEQAGLGGNLVDKTNVSEMAIGDLINYIDLKADKKPFGYYKDGSTTNLDTKLYEALNITIPKLTNGNTTFPKGNKTNQLIINGERVYSTDKDVNFTLSNLLDDDVVMHFYSGINVDFWKTSANKITNTAAFSNNEYVSLSELLNITGNSDSDATKVGTQDQIVLDTLDKMFKGFHELLDTDNSKISQSAFLYAIQETFELLAKKYPAEESVSSSDPSKTTGLANKYNGWVKRNGEYSLSISNIAESFLTYYAQGLGGYDSSYFVSHESANSRYVTDDPGYYYRVHVGGDPVDNQQVWNGEFYSMLFNNIVENGWYENSNIEDNTYLQNAIKNAQLFISSIHTDGFMYQERYLANGFVLEETDEDAITQAELEFTLIKSKLNSKEEKLDIEMKKIDLEISSLTTEYDTVKGLINKNVEKTFTMFQG